MIFFSPFFSGTELPSDTYQVFVPFAVSCFLPANNLLQGLEMELIQDGVLFFLFVAYQSAIVVFVFVGIPPHRPPCSRKETPPIDP